MMCTPKHTHTGNTDQVMSAEVTTLKADTQQVQSAEGMFCAHLFVLLCYLLVLITIVTSFPMMHEKHTNCPVAIRLQPQTTVYDIGFQTSKKIHSKNQKLCMCIHPLSVSPIYIQKEVLQTLSNISMPMF